jgi:peptidoglycan/xylan/chitin deacetylase (PgdA/CDA1 family)
MRAAVKKYLLKGLGYAGATISLPRLVSLSGYKLFLPFYHTVGSNLRHITHLYPARSEKQFRDDLDFFLKYFQPLDTEGLAKGIRDGFPKGKRYFYLSFDDGLSEVYHTAHPILKQKGIPYALFINPAFVGNKRLFFPHKASLILDALDSKGNAEGSAVRKLLEAEGVSYATLNKGLRMAGHTQEQLLDEAAQIIGIDFEAFLANEKPYMTVEEIRKLHDDGVTIGAHSIDHPLYNLLPFNEQIRQTTESIAYVQEHFKEKYRVFSFPFTDHGVSHEFFEKVHDKNNPVADITFGCAGLKKEIYPRHLQRVPMEAYAEPAARQIRAKYLFCLLLKIIGKDKIRRS